MGLDDPSARRGDAEADQCPHCSTPHPPPYRECRLAAERQRLGDELDAALTDLDDEEAR